MRILKTLIIRIASVVLLSVVCAWINPEAMAETYGLPVLKNGECYPERKLHHFGVCGILRGEVIYELDAYRFELDGFDAYNSRFYNVKLPEASLRFAYFHQVSIILSEIVNAKAHNINLRGAILWNSNFSKTIFNHADMKGVKIRRSNFKEASFVGAQLQSSFFWASDFSNASFRGSDLTDAVILGCDFNGALFDEDTKLPFGAETAEKLGMIRVNDSNDQK